MSDQTIITPGGSNDGGLGIGVILGIVIAIAGVVLLFVYYGLPAIQQEKPQTQNINVNLKLPTPTPTPEPAQ